MVFVSCPGNMASALEQCNTESIAPRLAPIDQTPVRLGSYATMYMLLSGAKQNLGDFLITERAEALLRSLRPAHDVVIRPAWEPLSLEDPDVKRADAIIIAGGPGYRRDMVPKVYPLVPCLEDLPCPVVPLGVGFKGAAADPFSLRQYRFSERTLEFLRIMARRGVELGCRDRPTVTVLRDHGLDSARLIGCPVWYELGSLGKAVTLPRVVRRLVFTPAQAHVLAGQSIALAVAAAKLFPTAEKYCSFHRGLDRSAAFVPAADLENNQRIADAVREVGYESVDVTGDPRKAGFYGDCCLHVGYRVHAHIDFLSRRRPSLLINEDGRGAGVASTLDIQGVDAYQPIVSASMAMRVPARPLQRVVGRYLTRMLPSALAVEAAIDILRQDVDTGFARFAGLSQVIDAHFELMRQFIDRLPGS